MFDIEMASTSNMSLPREKCMKCEVLSDILLSSNTPFEALIGNCDHKFCQSCFRKENTNLDLTITSNHSFKCPCCHIQFYQKMQSIDEAVLIGEAVTISNHISSPLSSTDTASMIQVGHLTKIHQMNMSVIEKLEVTLQLNSTNTFSIFLLFICCSRGHRLLCKNQNVDFPKHLYTVKVVDNAFKVLDNPIVSKQGVYDVKSECYYQLSRVFNGYCNYPAAHKYAKLAYENGIRSVNSSRRANLAICKAHYLELRAAFDKLPPLRFAVGDEVEFLHELETGSEWKLGTVVELYYRERNFAFDFSAPYRI